MDSLNLKSGTILLTSIITVNKQTSTNKPLIPILHENALRFTGYQNGEIYFEITNHSEFDLTIDILNTNQDKINKTDLLRTFETIKIKRNEILGCTMVLEGYVTDKGEHLMFRDEKRRCFGVIKIVFDRVFRATSLWEICAWECRRRRETDGGFSAAPRGKVIVCDGIIFYTSRASLRVGRTLEQVRFKETVTSETFYVSIKYDFGIIYPDGGYKKHILLRTRILNLLIFIELHL